MFLKILELLFIINLILFFFNLISQFNYYYVFPFYFHNSFFKYITYFGSCGPPFYCKFHYIIMLGKLMILLYKLFSRAFFIVYFILLVI